MVLRVSRSRLLGLASIPLRSAQIHPRSPIHRVPVLGSIPLIGALFRRRDSVEERQNLLIFVTASVISERGESLVVGASPGKSEEPAP